MAKLLGIIAALLGLLTGCSAVQFTYNQGSSLAYWWLDRYADFSSAQEPRVKAALEDWFSWHRQQQLPEYAQALAALQARVQGPVTPEQVCGEYVAWRQRAERAFDQAVPALADLARQLAPVQIASIAQRQRRVLADAERDELQADPAERREARLQRLLGRFEDFYGPLDDAQRRLLADAVAASPYDAERMLAERRARQQDLLNQLRDWQGRGVDAATAQAGLRRLAHEALHSPRPGQAVHLQRVQQATCAMVAQLHNSSTPTQRRHLVAKLAGWEGDLRALARQPSVVAARHALN